MKKNNEIKTISAKKYYDKKSGRYIFPFQVLDDTPGGSNLGRIEVCIEPFRSKRKIRGRYYVDKILIWFCQTRDKKYSGKTFEIPCFAESICGDSLNRFNSYTACIWRMSYCEIHKQIIMDAYPRNEHSKLIIDVSSSISIDLEFN